MRTWFVITEWVKKTWTVSKSCHVEFARNAIRWCRASGWFILECRVPMAVSRNANITHLNRSVPVIVGSGVVGRNVEDGMI